MDAVPKRATEIEEMVPAYGNICAKVQSPFVTLFLYLRADDPYIEENAMIIEEVLRQRLEGIKNEAGAVYHPRLPQAGLCPG